jgi:hypothetical protein
MVAARGVEGMSTVDRLIDDEGWDPTAAADAAMSVMDRLLDHAPAGAQDLRLPPPACCASPPLRVAPLSGRRQPKNLRDERAAQAALYGAHTRSGQVTAAPSDLTFQYVETDVPPGMRLADWRSQNNATPGADTPRAA